MHAHASYPGLLDSSFARPGSALIWGGKKGEFRNWTASRQASREERLKTDFGSNADFHMSRTKRIINDNQS